MSVISCRCLCKEMAQPLFSLFSVENESGFGESVVVPQSGQQGKSFPTSVSYRGIIQRSHLMHSGLSRIHKCIA